MDRAIDQNGMAFIAILLAFMFGFGTGHGCGYNGGCYDTIRVMMKEQKK